MHKHIIATAAAAFLFASTGAWAGHDVKGTVQSIDAQSMTITLADGKAYKAQEGVDLASLKAGDSVTIQTKEENGQTVVTKITKS